jgi:hypothetical protein
MKILLRDFNIEVGREDIFKPTVGNESLHEISNDNGVRVVNFATSKNLIVKSMMFPHCSIHKYTWTSPDGNTHNQIGQILIDRQKHSSVLDIRSFRAVDYDKDHYLVEAKIRERLAVNKQGSHKFHMQRFNLKKLNEVEGKEKYHVEVSNSPRPKYRWIDNIKMDLLEIGLSVVDWIGLAQDMYRWKALVNAVMNLRVP